MADELLPRITRVKLTNYKSIVSCDVELRPLTILVGPNGSGKSNFVDALRFVSEALTVGLEQAIRNRGNMSRILSEARPAGESSFSIQIDYALPSGESGSFACEIDAESSGRFRVIRERLCQSGLSEIFGAVLYEIDEEGAHLWATPEVANGYPRMAGERLYLPSYSDMDEGRPAYDLLKSMCFYNPQPTAMRPIRPSESGLRLLPDGANFGRLLRLAQAEQPEVLERITAYLAHVQPGLRQILVEDLRGYDLPLLRQSLSREPGWWDAHPDQVSDGTLRALGVFVALFQGRLSGESNTSLVSIEEPELGLHPAAMDVLFDALLDASQTTQVLVTTHSADLLQNKDLDTDGLLAVVAEDGVTRIGPIDEIGRSVLLDRLFTAGDLLQMKQLRPVSTSSAASGGPEVTEPASAR